MTRCLVTGSTGWFGTWLVPFLERKGMAVLRESRRHAPPIGKFEYIVHCSRGPAAPYAKYLQTGGSMLVCSSGSVQFDCNSEYAKGKREDEFVPGVKIARCFSFIAHDTPDRYAAGQFLRANPITVKGNGSNMRSYMHMKDLCEWLHAILVWGRRGIPYNVGSEEPVSISKLADMIAAARGLPRPEIEFGEDRGMRWYLPNTMLARDELGLCVKINLEEAINESVKHAVANTARPTDVQAAAEDQGREEHHQYGNRRSRLRYTIER